MAALVAALGAAAAIAACGGSSSSGHRAAPAASAGLKFASCMRSHGVPDYPDPRAGKVTVDIHTLSETSQAVDAATSKCRRFTTSTVTGPRVTNEQLATARAGGLAYSRCVRAHGIDIGDLGISRGPGGHGLEAGWSKAELREHPIPYKSPAWKKVNDECGRLLTRSMPASMHKAG